MAASTARLGQVNAWNAIHSTNSTKSKVYALKTAPQVNSMLTLAVNARTALQIA